MAFPSVTNTFTNGTTIDAPEVNTNFTDIINGFSDGTKDINMNAATLAGTVTMNGAVTLGNATGDDITFNGSLASSIPIKTTHSFDIGTTTVGLKDIFLGSSAGAFTTQITGADVAASKTVTFWGFDITLPAADGNAGEMLTTDGAGTASWSSRDSSMSAINYGLTVAIDGASGMDVTIVGADGAALGATNVASIQFRSATLTTGTPVARTAAAAVTLKIDSGATLGTTSAKDETIYIYAIDNSGTIELAVSSNRFREDRVYSTTVLDGSADDKDTIYSETARANVPIRLIGEFISQQATAGTWLTAPTEIYPGKDEFEVVIASYETNAGQSINENAIETIDFEDKLIDTHDAVTTGAAWIFTAPLGGKYCIEAKAQIVSTNYAGGIELRFAIVAGGTTWYPDWFEMGGSTFEIGMNGSIIADLDAGDTVYARIYQNGGGVGSRSLVSTAGYNYININRIG